MTIYNYSPVTGEYTGASMADPSPLEPGVWLLPAYATEIEPLKANTNEVAVFDGAEWKIEPDYRGQRAWLATDYDDDVGTEITGIGPLGNYSLNRPAVPLEIRAERNAEKVAALAKTQKKAALFVELKTRLSTDLGIEITTPDDLAGRSEEIIPAAKARRSVKASTAAKLAEMEKQVELLTMFVALLSSE